MLPIGRTTLYANQGDTFALYLELLDDDSQEIDLSNYEVEFIVSLNVGSATRWAYRSDDATSYITKDDLSGAITISIPPAQTELWSYKRLTYEIKLHTESDTYTFLQGRLVMDLALQGS